jgi:tRNA dimethylallyltransferase
MSKTKLIVILGPTATGKSDIAVKVARDFNGEIISADSRQVYKGLDIGSGKITKKEMEDIPHHLLDVASPKQSFSVVRFKRLAQKAIKEIYSKGKIPIVCGGTGFYIDSLVYDLNLPEVKADLKLRKQFEKKSLKDLQKQLKKLDKERFEEIDIKNKVRLVRAIEVAKALGKVPKVSRKSPYDVLWIGIDWPKEKLKERIYKRLIVRMKGMKQEVKKLRKSGLSFKRMEKLGLEYRNLSLLEQKKITEEEFIEKLNIEIRQYAKRQRTWFKRNPVKDKSNGASRNINWVIPPKYSEVKKLMKSFTD